MTVLYSDYEIKAGARCATILGDAVHATNDYVVPVVGISDRRIAEDAQLVVDFPLT